MIPLLLALTLSSPDVKDGAMIPRAFVWNRDGCDGENRTPRLQWTAPPPGTRELRLIVIDHDAPKFGGWVHWLVTKIPPSARHLGPDAAPKGAVVAKNDFGTEGWGGPCPPPGQLHHYLFKLDALDADGKILASSRLTAVYRR